MNITQIVATGIEANVVTSPSEVNPSDAAQFRDLLADQAIDDVMPADAVKASGDDMSLGDAILRSMEGLQNSHENQVGKVNELVSMEGDAQFNFQTGMKLQFEIMQLNLQQDVTTKVADKSSQSVQTLFKNQ